MRPLAVIRGPSQGLRTTPSLPSQEPKWRSRRRIRVSSFSVDIRIRLELPADISASQEVVAAAFGRRGEAVPNLLLDMRNSSAWRDLSFVAEVEGRIVGHVAYTRGWVDAPSQLVEVLILSPMSVHPDFQRQGVGRRLIGESIATLTTPLVFLEGDPAYYSKLGFVSACALGFLRPSDRIPEPAFQVIRLAAYEPWMSGRLVYPDVFWRHDCVGLRG